MVDGASKLDEKLDGAPFAMFVLAAQDGVEREFWKFDGLLVCHDTSELNLDKIIVLTTRTRTRTSSFTLKTYQQMPIVRIMI